jgi:hypothetical protein
MKSKYLLGLVTAMFCCTAGASEFVYKIHESGLTATSPPLVAPPAPSAPTVWATATSTISIDSSGLVASNNNTTGGWQEAQASNGHASGKWYWETAFDSGAQAWSLGMQSGPPTPTVVGYSGYAYMGYTGRLENNGAYVSTGTTATTGVTIGIAADLDKGTIAFTVNCTPLPQNITFTTGATLFPTVTLIYTSKATANFGSSAFKCAVPTGYQAGW